MNFPSPVTNAQHGYSGQKVLEYLAQLQQQNTWLKQPLDWSQKEPESSQKGNTPSPNSPEFIEERFTSMTRLFFFLAFLLLLPLCRGHDPLFEPYLPVSQALGIGNFDKPEVSSLAIVTWMMAGHSGSASGQVDWPFAGYFGFGDSRLTGQKAHPEMVSAMPTPEAGSVETLLCLEPAIHTINPLPYNCRSLPADACGLVVSHDPEVVDGESAPLFFPVPCDLPFTKAGASLYPLPCDDELCLGWESHSQKITLDFSQARVPDNFLRLVRRAGVLPGWFYQTTDQQGQVIYYWYDSQGNRHSISQQEYRLMLSGLFESLMHRFYPEVFDPPLPAGGGWHIWLYTRKSKPAGRQGSGRGRAGGRGKIQLAAGGRGGNPDRKRPDSKPGQRPVAYVKPQPRAGATGTRKMPEKAPDTRAAETIASLVKEFKTGDLEAAAKRFKKKYNGKDHSYFCNRIKLATKKRGFSLTLEEKKQLQPFVTHLAEVILSSQFSGKSVSTCVHSLTSSQLLYPFVSDRGLAGEIDTLTKALLIRVAQVRDLDSQGLSSLVWALAKLVEKGLEIQQTHSAVTALLPQVVEVAEQSKKKHEKNSSEVQVTEQASRAQLPQAAEETSPRDRFSSQGVSNVLWALGKLVEKGLEMQQVNSAVTELLPLVVQMAEGTSPEAGFSSQGVSNLLWALAKLVESGLRMRQANSAVTALLPQVVQVAEGASCQDGFIPQHVASLLWALTKLMENGLEIQQAHRAVTAMLLRVAQIAEETSPRDGFSSQGVSNVLWALGKLVENGLRMRQANSAVTALLPLVVQVVEQSSREVVEETSPEAGFNSQGVSNLMWALAKLVENGLEMQQAKSAVTALLPLVVQMAEGTRTSPRAGFNPQEVANLLWALAKLMENGLEMQQAHRAVTELLPQVVQMAEGASPRAGFSPQEVTNLLWALTKLVGNGLEMQQAHRAVTALLTQVVQIAEGRNLRAGFNPQEVANLLWALAKLVENGLEMQQAHRAVTALLPQVVQVAGGMNLRAGFNAQEVANLLWALAKLVERGLEMPQTNRAVTALLTQVVQMSEGTSLRAGFRSQGVANLLWALAKLVENGLEMQQAHKAMTALLPQVVEVAEKKSLEAGFSSQAVSNLLWALAKLMENGLGMQQAHRAVTALLTQVVQIAEGRNLRAGFNPQEVANLLWALAKLMENGLEMQQAHRAVTALLPQVVQVAEGASPQAGFNAQEVANLLWALAKLVENGLEMQQAHRAVTALLPQVVQVAEGASPQAEFSSQGVANLLWALAKLVENGLEMHQIHRAVTALLSQVVQMAEGTSPQVKFNSQDIVSILWSIAFLGEFIEPQTIEGVLNSFSFDKQYSVLPQAQLLWSFMVFMARKVSINNQLILLVKSWYQTLAQQKNDEQLESLLTIAGIWLEQEPFFNPKYKTRPSQLQNDFKTKLTNKFPNIEFSEEQAFENLPPLDFFIGNPYRLGIEIQGPHHFTDQESLSKTGKTILKVETYKKVGLDVIEVPYRHLNRDNLSWVWAILLKKQSVIQQPRSSQ
ncbi:DUF1601 domain-containing protein [Endozoicomonas euniceicola]|uniref:DUF1601 domain-containing protein n=1 Tax=Endozoicomonas euniceicola TaxID=1234143 RepID=A0ABY6GY18_9GAMM|nr:DUF1601 domain-containing protein [Endozoicomonas euniceicola]UYM17693.1 DUF1601 domain-containing protein [Endozoicomonas euniceicola]